MNRGRVEDSFMTLVVPRPSRRFFWSPAARLAVSLVLVVYLAAVGAVQQE